jgi:transcriptional regulator with XRE-family HTH domain
LLRVYSGDVYSDTPIGYAPVVAGLSDRLREARKGLRPKVRQEDVADAMDVAQSAVSKWETGETTPDALQIVKLAALYGVTAEYLVGHGDRKPKPLGLNSSVTQGSDDRPLTKGGSDVPASESAAQTRVLREVTDAYETLAAEVRALHEQIGAIVARVERDPLGLEDRPAATKSADRRRRRGTAR